MTHPKGSPGGGAGDGGSRSTGRRTPGPGQHPVPALPAWQGPAHPTSHAVSEGSGRRRVSLAWVGSGSPDLNRVSHLWEKDVGSHPGSEITQERSRPPLRFKITVPKLRGRGASRPRPGDPRSRNRLWGDTQVTVFTGKSRGKDPAEPE